VRRVLDRHRADPALRPSERAELRLIAIAVGHATVGDPIAHSAAAGARYVASIRRADVPDRHRPSLRDRLVAAFSPTTAA
jgi:hypothetical protein